MRIVSGAQTGADRAALDAALELGLPCGGWVPRGRWAEDGPVSTDYPNLEETPSRKVSVRTEWNVRDSDATLIVSHGPLTGGSALTQDLARKWKRPALHLDLAALDPESARRRLCAWLDAIRPGTLNVAGPRASRDPEVYEATRALLRAALSVPPRPGAR